MHSLEKKSVFYVGNGSRILFETYSRYTTRYNRSCIVFIMQKSWKQTGIATYPVCLENKYKVDVILLHLIAMLRLKGKKEKGKEQSLPSNVVVCRQSLGFFLLILFSALCQVMFFLMLLMLILCWFLPILGTKMPFTQHLYLVFAFTYWVRKYLG